MTSGLFVLCLLGPLAAHAAPAAELRGYIVGGAAFSTGYSFSQSVTPAAAGSHVTRSLTDTGPDLSYAHGRVDTTFGSLRAYADAHEVNTGGGAPQSNVESEFIDYIKPWATSPVGYTNYTLTLTLSGSHSLTDPYGPFPGYSALGSISYDIRDNQTGDVFVHGYYDTTDATPSTLTLTFGVNVPPPEGSDDMRIDISLEAYAYVSNLNPSFQTAFADYANTLVVHLDAVTPGAGTVGASGYDYSTAASVPELSSAWMLWAGLAALGSLRRARAVA
jgi:hypothetical protein